MNNKAQKSRDTPAVLRKTMFTTDENSMNSNKHQLFGVRVLAEIIVNNDADKALIP